LLHACEWRERNERPHHRQKPRVER
jgi:hypothetical protein